MSYLLNNLSHPLTLKQGYLVIKAGCTSDDPLSDADLQEQSINYALTKGWAKKVNKAVKKNLVPEMVVTEVGEVKSGMSEEDFKKSLATPEIQVEQPVVEQPVVEAPVAPIEAPAKKNGKKGAASTAESTVEASNEAEKV